jgi:hypothetical protein
MQEDSSPETLLRMRSDKPAYTAASLVASYKLDEGYSDDSRSQLEGEVGNESSFLPDWILGHSEPERAGAWVYADPRPINPINRHPQSLPFHF